MLEVVLGDDPSNTRGLLGFRPADGLARVDLGVCLKRCEPGLLRPPKSNSAGIPPNGAVPVLTVSINRTVVSGTQGCFKEEWI